jgi:hypothetical protein
MEWSTIMGDGCKTDNGVVGPWGGNVAMTGAKILEENVFTLLLQEWRAPISDQGLVGNVYVSAMYRPNIISWWLSSKR